MTFYRVLTRLAAQVLLGLAVFLWGAIALLDSDGVTGVTGGGVTDVTLTNNGRYLYALRSGAGAIAIFRIEEHGALTALGAVSVPSGANGIAAR